MDLDLPNCYVWPSFLAGDGMPKKKPFIQFGDYDLLYRLNCNIKSSLNYNLAHHKLEESA